MRRNFTCVLFILCFTVATFGQKFTTVRRAAASPPPDAQNLGADYFPLQTGNQWIFRATDGSDRVQIVTVGDTRTIGDQTYFQVNDFRGRSLLVREDAAGVVYAYDADAQRESVAYAFQTPENETFTNVLNPCARTARVMARTGMFDGKIGRFGDALTIAYPEVFQCGIAEETFLPGIGPVKWTEVRGPAQTTFEITYARIGGTTVLSAPEIGFSLALDRAIYTSNLMPPVDPNQAVPQFSARLTVRNTQADPLRIVFRSGQIYELVIRNEKRDIVYRWSDGKNFTQALRGISYGPGETNYVIVARLGDFAAGKPFPPGRYTAEAWLVTLDDPGYRATVAFDIQQVQ